MGDTKSRSEIRKKSWEKFSQNEEAMQRFKDKISHATKGRKLTDEQKRQRAETMKRVWSELSPEQKSQKKKGLNKGLTEQGRKNVSIASRERMKNLEQKRREFLSNEKKIYESKKHVFRFFSGRYIALSNGAVIDSDIQLHQLIKRLKKLAFITFIK